MNESAEWPLSSSDLGAHRLQRSSRVRRKLLIENTSVKPCTRARLDISIINTLESKTKAMV